ncbi:ABC transporter permease [Rhizobium sp. BK376]|uniref:ABC transporter permease n=1 Tax=Rhizobium sp. BK376 TaxID=2512149 RepID=UPI0010E71864|nr:ABC transporter permease [Rhizobium sp. BK376]TCR85267.1 putative ABC transport system permease protein [Rhizobium sp. BK376]
MIVLMWLCGVARTRSGRLAGMAIGIAVTVALLCDLGTFLNQSAASMTIRAIRGVPIDWQVELAPGADVQQIKDAVRAATTVRSLEDVNYADVDGFEFNSSDGVQVTGPGKVVGISADYLQAFPGGFRLLSGSMKGPILLQQTAANLHAAPGDAITVHRPGLSDASITVAGVVDLTTADTFFQAVGVPRGSAPPAPPDNAVILPSEQWHGLFDPLVSVRPTATRQQIHVLLDHRSLPSAPDAAYLSVSQAGRNLEVRVAGSASLANNLAAQLDATRADALYAHVLFLFLGAPGVVLATLLTIAVAGAGADRRRLDSSLLRLRGADYWPIFRFALAETGLIGVVGSCLGTAFAVATAPLFGQTAFGEGRALWVVVASVVGLCLSAFAVLVPAMRSARQMSITEARQIVGRRHEPLWERLFIDLICLGLAGLVFTETATSGYQVVLATEGVTAISVDYNAFLAPMLLWIGSALLTVRVIRFVLAHEPALLVSPARMLVGNSAPALLSSLLRQRGRISASVAFAALATAFAVSTAIFNTTYQAQANVDALLTNGADVTVAGTATAPAGRLLDRLRRITGVIAAEPMQHRFTYVGTDLQDLYGIDAERIRNATPIVDAYFGNGDADASLAALARTENAVLVSEETVTDFQLAIGDTINLRIQTADGAYHPVPFVFAGVVREFPTAPRDSFVVANAGYVARMTDLNSAETVLIKTSREPDEVKAAAADLVSGLPGARVTALSDAAHVIGSSLTAIDLAGLTRLELAFAFALAVGATALMLSLGLADRRRNFAILSALGATRRQLLGFILAEGLLVLLGGALFGVWTGWLVADMLVTVLQGVFDPPPEYLSIPWAYLVSLAVVTLVTTGAALANAIRDAVRAPIERLREFR